MVVIDQRGCGQAMGGGHLKDANGRLYSLQYGNNPRRDVTGEETRYMATYLLTY